MKLGIEVLLENDTLLDTLKGRRLALLAHPASVTREIRHTLDALMVCPGLDIVAAFGPQHGIKGDKQDNMIETEDSLDHRYNIPVYSLYSRVRRPSAAMMKTFDHLLVDLQDIGTRVYTYITTLTYMLEACAQHKKSIWILDRPNPVGRPVEGTILEAGWESFVGVSSLIMRHGFTLGEFALWFVETRGLKVDIKVIEMTDYKPDAAPGFGWPLSELAWVNPSPNASSLNMARCFPGTVLFEGTTLSEGRGTTTALEVVGAPDIDFDLIYTHMKALMPRWLNGVSLRPCFFEPTFHKHVGKTCAGIQIHTDNALFKHEEFRPYRLAALILKAIRLNYPKYKLWRDFPYEYETARLAIDVLSGGPFLRTWVDDGNAGPQEFDEKLNEDEQTWQQQRQPFLRY